MPHQSASLLRISIPYFPTYGQTRAFNPPLQLHVGFLPRLEKLKASLLSDSVQNDVPQSFSNISA